MSAAQPAPLLRAVFSRENIRETMAASGWIAFFGAIFLLYVVPGSFDGLRYERGLVFDGQWWRVASAGFVHLNPTHLGMNGVMLALLSFAWPRATWKLVAFVLAASALVFAGTHLLTRYEWACGLSGALHGAFILVVAARLSDRYLTQPTKVAAGVVLAIGALVVKLALEVTGLDSSSAIEATVLTHQHVIGAILGVAFVVPGLLGFARARKAAVTA